MQLGDNLGAPPKHGEVAGSDVHHSGRGIHLVFDFLYINISKHVKFKLVYKYKFNCFDSCLD